jgi:hypothetical protein
MATGAGAGADGKEIRRYLELETVAKMDPGLGQVKADLKKLKVDGSTVFLCSSVSDCASDAHPRFHLTSTSLVDSQLARDLPF